MSSARGERPKKKRRRSSAGNQHGYCAGHGPGGEDTREQEEKKVAAQRAMAARPWVDGCPRAAAAGVTTGSLEKQVATEEENNKTDQNARLASIGELLASVAAQP
jgi:hypothetical protein